MTTQRRQSGRPQRGGYHSKRATSGPVRSGETPNEGEGSRTAARDYNQRTARFIDSDRVEESAQKAKHAIEGDERDELLEAERIGRNSGKP